MKLTNGEIYNIANNLSNIYIEGRIPVKVNFFLQKNIQKIIQMAQEIDVARLEIGRAYGEYDEATGNYSIPQENLEVAQKELNDLFYLEQDVPIHIFSIEDFEDISLTNEQLLAIMFMIED